MSKIAKPTEADLAPLLAEGTQNGKLSEEEWRSKLLSSFARLLERKPLQYRCFGPYWWLFKSLLIAHGVETFGAFVDAEWKEKMDYGRDTPNLLACFAYYDWAFDMGLVYSHEHGIAYEDGESGDYTLIDEDMETLAIG